MSSIGNNRIFSKNLAYYLEKSGSTQREVADAVGVAYPTFNDWVKAKKYPRIDKIEKLANFFGIQKSDLIEDKLSEESAKDNDVLANIIVRARMDKNFLSIITELYELDSSKLKSVEQMLEALKTFNE